MNIYLIGYRCTGKTSCGKKLSSMTGRLFKDTDTLFSEAEKTTISDFVKKVGWPAFRQKEHDILCSLSKEKNLIVSTGGGIVLEKANVQRMKRTGKTIWLSSTPSIIYTRIKEDQDSKKTRPALTGMALFEEIKVTLKERTPIYAVSADCKIDTDAMSIEKVCETIIHHLFYFGDSK